MSFKLEIISQPLDPSTGPSCSQIRVNQSSTLFIMTEFNIGTLLIGKKPKGKGRPKNQTFTEGWIEFKKRRHAKKVAEMLNNRAVGGKKSKEYHDHLWNIKYLPG